MYLIMSQQMYHHASLCLLHCCIQLMLQSHHHHQPQGLVLLDSSSWKVQLRIGPSIIHMVYLFSYLLVYTDKIFQQIFFHPVFPYGGNNLIFNYFVQCVKYVQFFHYCLVSDTVCSPVTFNSPQEPCFSCFNLALLFIYGPAL